MHITTCQSGALFQKLDSSRPSTNSWLTWPYSVAFPSLTAGGSRVIIMEQIYLSPAALPKEEESYLQLSCRAAARARAAFSMSRALEMRKTPRYYRARLTATLTQLSTAVWNSYGVRLYAAAQYNSPVVILAIAALNCQLISSAQGLWNSFRRPQQVRMAPSMQQEMPSVQRWSSIQLQSKLIIPFHIAHKFRTKEGWSSQKQP